MNLCIRLAVRPQAFAVSIALCAFLPLPAAAQAEEPAAPLTAAGISLQAAEENVEPAPAEYVSIHVDGGDIRQVLNSFSMQSRRNIVIGPEVTNDNVTIHLDNIQWENALDVILKPYGYGYHQVGDATVVGELEKLKALETIEPLHNRIYKLNYLDAGDVKEIVAALLSPRGKMSIITARGHKGWDFGSAQRRAQSRSGSSLQKRERIEDDDQAKSKTVVVSDVPSVLDRITETLSQIDNMPQQVLVEARFIEVNEDLLRDIGLQMGIEFEIDNKPIGISERFFDAEPNSFGQLSEDVTGKSPLSTFGQITAAGAGYDWNLLISALQEDEDTKTLSAPKVLTLNNQEATIIVGRKFPIIESDVSGGGNTDAITVSLDYYENIGIQLNVVPQICAENYINMIVHPSVSSIESFVSAGVGSINSQNNVPLAEYPIIKVRDAETQILVADKETIVIGGLLEERETDGTFKVPLLGDIPFIGRLFRRDTKDSQTIDLLIFLSATIIDSDNYHEILESEQGIEVAAAEADLDDMTIEPNLDATAMETELKDITAEPDLDDLAIEPNLDATALEPELKDMTAEPDLDDTAMEPEDDFEKSIAQILEELM